MVAVATAQPAAPPAARRFKLLDDSSSSSSSGEEAPALQASVAKKVAAGVAPRTIMVAVATAQPRKRKQLDDSSSSEEEEAPAHAARLQPVCRVQASVTEKVAEKVAAIAWEARTWAQVPAALSEAVFLVPGWGSAKANKLVDLCPEWARPIDLVEATAETIAAVVARLREEKAGISALALCKLRGEFCNKHKAASGAANFDARDAASAAQAESQAISRAADAARKRTARQSMDESSRAASQAANAARMRTAPAQAADAARKRTARQSMDESAQAASQAADAARKRTARQSMAQDRPDDREVHRGVRALADAP